MQRATSLFLVLFFSGCVFDSSGLNLKNYCNSNSDCLEGSSCNSGICEMQNIPEKPNNQDLGSENIDNEKTDETDKENNNCMAEICDNLDNDCDEEIDEDFNINEPCEIGIGICRASGHYVCYNNNSTICNAVERLWLKTDEICDGVDNDCDGQTDEETTDCCIPSEIKICGNDIGECQFGIQVCLDFGIWSACNSKNPDLEICDNLDNDCDGEIDEDSPCESPGICQRGECVDVGCQIMEYRNHTYAYCSQELVWIEAVNYCRRYNGHLVTINDLLEDGFFHTLQFGYISAWIGLKDIEQENTWTWESGEISDIFEWAQGEPNNRSGFGTGEEDCVEIRMDSPFNGSWNDAFCGLNRPFFCEWNELF